MAAPPRLAPSAAARPGPARSTRVGSLAVGAGRVERHGHRGAGGSTMASTLSAAAAVAAARMRRAPLAWPRSSDRHERALAGRMAQEIAGPHWRDPKRLARLEPKSLAFEGRR